MAIVSNRQDIYERDNFCCWYCGKDLKDAPRDGFAPELTLDHLTPKKRGGNNSPSNLVTCCRTCNNNKKTKTLDEYREYIARKRHAGARARNLIEMAMAEGVALPSELQGCLEAAVEWLNDNTPPVVFFGERERD